LIAQVRQSSDCSGLKGIYMEGVTNSRSCQ
jgi:hypothetical protein